MAPLAIEKSLREMFIYLSNKNNENFQEDFLSGKMDEQSLQISLKYCIEHFKGKANGQKTLDMWHTIALNGPGILRDSIQDMFIENYTKQDVMSLSIEKTPEGPEEQPKTPLEKFEDDLKDLINFSLIEEENLDKAGTQKRLRVSPFIEQYVNTAMKPSTKKEFYNLICQ